MSKSVKQMEDTFTEVMSNMNVLHEKGSASLRADFAAPGMPATLPTMASMAAAPQFAAPQLAAAFPGARPPGLPADSLHDQVPGNRLVAAEPPSFGAMPSGWVPDSSMRASPPSFLPMPGSEAPAAYSAAVQGVLSSPQPRPAPPTFSTVGSAAPTAGHQSVRPPQPVRAAATTAPSMQSPGGTATHAGTAQPATHPATHTGAHAGHPAGATRGVQLSAEQATPGCLPWLNAHNAHAEKR